MHVAVLVLYVAALAAYAWHFAKRQLLAGRVATTLLVAGALAHTFLVGMLTMEVGHLPVSDASSAISTFVWLLVLAYLYTEMTTDERSMGLFVTALVVAIQSIPTIKPGIEDQSSMLQGPLFEMHVGSLLFAYASFALACIIGITYVLLFKELKAKHLGFFYARLPPLQVLHSMNQRATLVGWIFLTVGLVAGAIWAGQAPAHDARVQAMSLRDPKIFVALVCWLVYSFEVVAARRLGGRWTAILSTLGFAIVLLNFVPISYFLTRSHDF